MVAPVVVVAVLLVGVWAGLRGRAGRSARRRLGVGPRLPVADRSGRVERWLAPRLRAADLEWTAVDADRRLVLAGAGVALLGATVSPTLALVAPAALGGGAVLALHLAQGRRSARTEAELPELLEAVARSLRSGAAVPTALAEATTSGTAAAAELRSVLDDADRGIGLATALDRWTGRRPTPGVRLVVGALSVALTSGAGAARGVDGVAATLRERAEVDREGRSLATQGRASAVVVTLAPLAFAALGALGDERTLTFLLGSAPGLACLVAGLGLDAVGAWWMTRIVRGGS